jgi:hypothetical protein
MRPRVGNDLYARGVTEPRRVLIGWDYGASGIWWVLTKEEMEAPPPGGSWAGTAPPRRNERFRAWSDRLSQELLDDLQAWNDSWDNNHAPQENEEVTAQALQEQGRDLAVRVQNELGTDGWEVLYQIGGQMFRVHPPGIWPIKTWEQELLGYAPRDPRRAEEEARVRRAIRESQPQAGADGSTSTEP